MTFLCGTDGAPDDALRIITELRHCCYGAAELGPTECTCWEPVYDLEQQPLDRAIEPGRRTVACADCAYRPGSPERTGDENYSCSDDGELDDIARGSTFWCHDGMRKPVAWRHPLGITVEVSGNHYRPPIVEREPGVAVPYKAAGTPGERCAGWAARRAVLLGSEA